MHGNLVILLADTYSQNAFSTCLTQFGLSLFQMLVVDLLHEFELGIWKALFVHLIRILNAVNPALVNDLDFRYACRSSHTR